MTSDLLEKTKTGLFNLGLHAIDTMERAVQARPAQTFGLHLTANGRRALAARALCELSKFTPQSDHSRVRLLWLKRAIPLIKDSPSQGVSQALTGLASPVLAESAGGLLLARANRLEHSDQIEACNSILLQMAKKLTENLPDTQIALNRLGMTFYSVNWNEWVHTNTWEHIVPAVYTALDPKLGILPMAAALAEKVIDSMVRHSDWKSALHLAKTAAIATGSPEACRKWDDIYGLCEIAEPETARLAFAEATSTRKGNRLLNFIHTGAPHAGSNGAATCIMD